MCFGQTDYEIKGELMDNGLWELESHNWMHGRKMPFDKITSDRSIFTGETNAEISESLTFFCQSSQSSRLQSWHLRHSRTAGDCLAGHRYQQFIFAVRIKESQLASV